MTTYGYDRDGRVRRQIDALGREIGTDYNTSRDPLRRVDAAGGVTTYRYTESGDVAEITDPMGAVTRIDYAAPHQPSVVVRADGTRTSYTYDEHGNVATVIDNAGAVTGLTHDETGAVASVTDADGVVTRYETNGAGQPTRIIDAFGNAAEISYDPYGRAIGVVDEEGHTSSATYDAEGHRTSVTDPSGATQRWTYDGEGNCTGHTDAMGAVTRWEYGYFDLPVARVDADGARTDYSYDTARRLVAVTNAAGLRWRYEYDLDGTLATETDFNGAVTTHTYDQVGRLAQRRNASGQSVAFTYDACGRVVRESSGAADDSTMYAEEAVDYDYDMLGRLLRSRGVFGEWQAEYGANGLPVVYSMDNGRVDVEWTSAGQLSAVVTPSAMRTDFEYDARGLLESVTAAGRACLVSTDRVGRETRRRFDGTAIDSVWDPVGRLVGRSVVSNPVDPSALSLGGAVTAASGSAESVIESAGFAYRSDGALVGSSGSGGDVSHRLDVLGRVAEGATSTGRESYRFDQVGNVSAVDGGSGAAPTGWAFSGTLLTDDGRSSYRYDKSGRLVSKLSKRLSRRPDVWRYRWDAWDRLREVTVPDGTVFEYVYDHAGRRVAKVNTATGETTRFSWLGDVGGPRDRTKKLRPRGPLDLQRTHADLWCHREGETPAPGLPRTPYLLVRARYEIRRRTTRRPRADE
ncbi:hypothetical protein AAFP30_10685 [Gordonia sp. CPCC 205515]|uniref:hypothetical protein n=1 Tax=Gordonia sp. CPCC 205515 TaxID=3140791 RepID=UPI003AF3831E